MGKNSGAIGSTGAALGAATNFTGLGGLLGTAGVLAGMFGGGDEGSGYPDVSAILNAALDRAMGQNQHWTGKGINQLRESLGVATNAFNTSKTDAIKAAQDAAQQGFNLSQQLRAPYGRAGYNALDKWQQSLGLATPTGGSYNLVQNQQLADKLSPLLAELKGNYAAGTAPTLAETVTADTVNIDKAGLLQNLLSNVPGKIVGSGQGADINQLNQVKALVKHYSEGNRDIFNNPVNYNTLANPSNKNYKNILLNAMDTQANAYKQHVASQQNAANKAAYDSALNAYNTRSNNINQLNQMLQGVDINTLAPLLRGRL